MVVLAVALAALLVIAGLFAVRRIDEAHRTGVTLPAEAPTITPDPNLVVYWLGQQLDPPGTLPPLTYLLRGDASTDRYFNVTLQYAYGAVDEHADVTTILLEEMPLARWNAYVEQRRSTSSERESYWDDPCWIPHELTLSDGHATIYTRVGSALDDAAPRGAPTSASCAPREGFPVYAEAVLARTVVRVTTFDDNYQRRLPGQPDILEPYYSLAGLDAILRALVPQDPSNAGLIR